MLEKCAESVLEYQLAPPDFCLILQVEGQIHYSL